MSFYSGYLNNGDKDHDHYARCVRSGPFPSGGVSNYQSREYVNNEPVVMDMETGLIWQGKYVTGKSWRQAMAYCESLNYGGFDDWRLPNINELFTLVNLDKHDPASDFPGMPSYGFWSSSSVAGYGNHAWGVGFHHGNLGNLGKDGYNGGGVARCVRSGP